MYKIILSVVDAAATNPQESKVALQKYIDWDQVPAKDALLAFIPGRPGLALVENVLFDITRKEVVVFAGITYESDAMKVVDELINAGWELRSRSR